MIKHKVGRRRTNALSKTGLDTTFGLRECSTCMGLWANFILLVISLIGRLASGAHANGLKSLEMAHRAVSTLISGDSPIKRMMLRNNVDVASEIGRLMRRWQAENPTVSRDEIADALMAADRPLVARPTNASPAEKWQLIRQFDRMLKQLLAANTMPQGSLIVTNVPRRPAIDQKPVRQAQAGAESTVCGCHPDPYGGTIMMPWSPDLDLRLARAKLSAAGACQQADCKPRRSG